MGKIQKISGVILSQVLNILVLACLFGVIAVFAAPAINKEISTNAVKVLPERNLLLKDGTPWQAELQVPQGLVIRSGTEHYMAENAGTLGTNAPTIFYPGWETNGTVVLRYIEKGPRLGFIMMMETDGTMRVNVNTPPTPGSGAILDGRLSTWQESGSQAVPQGAIWAVSETGTNRVTAIEW
ncbi:MAG: hypothetical protein WC959_05485 [Kiritimatiellales bacterium]